jgi:hypothetical protein
MRLPRRVLSSLHGVFAFLAFAAFAFPLSAQTSASTPDSLPPKWNEAVADLAEKIAATSGSTKTLAIEMKNISSLSAVEASRIESALEAELKQRGMRIVTPTRAGELVQFTLSEGAEGLVWVVENRKGDSKQTFLIGVPRQLSGDNGQPNLSLSLAAHLVWAQPKEFLDFKQLTDSVTFTSTLVVVEPGALDFYRTNNLKWQLWRTIPFSHSGPWPRDPRGVFDWGDAHIYLPGLRCSGDFEQATVECSTFHPVPKGVTMIIPKVPGLDEWVEYTGVWDNCGDSSILLVTGTGDWTQPDSVQGYLFTDILSRPIASGSPISFDGPVLALREDGKGNAARAVVHNLKTGNYEGYIVTATCSH